MEWAVFRQERGGGQLGWMARKGQVMQQAGLVPRPSGPRIDDATEWPSPRRFMEGDGSRRSAFQQEVGSWWF